MTAYNVDVFYISIETPMGSWGNSHYDVPSILTIAQSERCIITSFNKFRVYGLDITIYALVELFLVSRESPRPFVILSMEYRMRLGLNERSNDTFFSGTTFKYKFFNE